MMFLVAWGSSLDVHGKNEISFIIHNIRSFRYVGYLGEAVDSCKGRVLFCSVNLTKPMLTGRLYRATLMTSFMAPLGDGAGGNLAAAVTLKLRDENWSPGVKMQVRRTFRRCEAEYESDCAR